jgi:hypothetical protein
VGPWGIPDELPDELDDLGAEEVVCAAVLLAGADVVVAAGALLVGEEELELLPQPAATMAATASATHVSPRTCRNFFIITNLCMFGLLGRNFYLETRRRTPTKLPRGPRSRAR